MNIKDTVYIVIQSTVYEIPMKNSVSIIKGEVLSINEGFAVVKMETEDGNNSSIIQQFMTERLFKTPQQALEKASNLIMTKEIRDESIQQN